MGRRAADAGGLALEDSYELLTDDLALALRVGHTLERGEELLGGVDGDERNAEVLVEGAGHLLGLTQPQQPIVDEHACKLVADGLVDEQRRHGRTDATGERADHLAGADLRADALDRLGHEAGWLPIVRAAADLIDKIAQQFAAK